MITKKQIIIIECDSCGKRIEVVPSSIPTIPKKGDIDYEWIYIGIESSHFADKERNNFCCSQCVKNYIDNNYKPK